MFVLIAAFCSLRAQGTLPPANFAWPAPRSMEFVTGYRLEWGPQDFADLPVHRMDYDVENLPVGLNIPIRISSLGVSQPSEPTVAYFFNITVAVEESTDLTTWTPVASVLVRGQRKPTSFLRLRLEGARE